MSASPCEAYLEAVIDSQPSRFALHGDAVCRIGRDENNNIVLPSSQVSRRHAIIECGATGKFYLADLGSRNGTFVNQRRVTAPVLLQPGDRITIAGYEFRFCGEAASVTGPGTTRVGTVIGIAQRMITVLVTDIRDFTGLSRRLGEAKLSQVITTFRQETGAALAARGAWAQKYIGDAVMALWMHQDEAPNSQEVAAVFSALATQFEIAEGLQSRASLDEPIRIGAGVNTGVACVGNLGSEVSSDYTAVSEAVNAAFRLESATKELGCDLVIGRRTYQFLAQHADAGVLFQRHTVKLKGYEEGTEVYAAPRTAVAIVLQKLHDALGEQVTQAIVT